MKKSRKATPKDAPATKESSKKVKTTQPDPVESQGVEGSAAPADTPTEAVKTPGGAKGSFNGYLGRSTQASQVGTPTTDKSDTVEMEVSVASAKRKVEDVDDFTPMPRNRVLSGDISAADNSLDMSEMLNQDSIYDGILDAQSPHTY